MSPGFFCQTSRQQGKGRVISQFLMFIFNDRSMLVSASGSTNKRNMGGFLSDDEEPQYR